jgi:hypothetical protein
MDMVTTRPICMNITYLAVLQADIVSSMTGLVLRWHSLVAFRQFGHSGLTASGGRIHLTKRQKTFSFVKYKIGVKKQNPSQLSKSNVHKEELLAHQRGRHRWCISMMHQDSSSQAQKLENPLDQARRKKESSFIMTVATVVSRVQCVSCPSHRSFIT